MSSALCGCAQFDITAPPTGADDVDASSPSMADAAPDEPDASIPSDWWDGDYPYRTQIVIDVPDLQSTLQDVPVLLVLNGARVPYLAGTPERGVRVVDAANNALDHEVEIFDDTGSSYLWVRIPTMDSASQVPLWLYHGGPGDASAPDGADVWSNGYLAVWHLAEQVEDEEVGGAHLDSTGNGHDGVQNDNGGVLDGTGAIGGAQDIDDDDYIAVPADNGLQLSYPEMTFTARVYLRDNPAIDFPHVVGSGGPESEGRYRQLYWNPGNSGWSCRFSTTGQGPLAHSMAGQPGEWGVLAAVYDGMAVRMYLDGQQVGDPAPLSGDLAAIETFYVGGNPDLDAATNQQRSLDGYLDELRVSPQARSADWLLVQSQSMNDALASYGATECLDGCPP